MKGLLRSAAIASAVVLGLSFGVAGPAEARGHSHFSLSVGIPLGGYYGPYAPTYRPYYGASYYGWYGGPYYDGYYVPRPVAYPRPAYRPYVYGPVVSLGLFPAYVGDVMTSDDRAIYYDAYRRALAGPVGEGMAWNTNHASGSVVTMRDGWAGQRYCREFRQDVQIDGRSQEAVGTACQAPNGDWQLVQNQSSAPDPY